MCKTVVVALVAVVFLGMLSASQGADEAAQQHNAIGVAEMKAPTAPTTDAAKQWFSQAGLGLFIHWGIASVSGHHDLSWGMMGNYRWTPHPLTPEAYWKLADQFNPQDYQPEKWLRAGKDAGFGYAVLTARHHDGYALWPSEYGDFSTRTKMGGRDLLRPYVDACRKVGLKVGFYYSPPDWHFNRRYMSFGSRSKGTPESPHLGLRHEPVELPKPPADFHDRYVAYVNGQIAELLTRYGKIDILWFDGGAGKGLISQEKIRELQPGILLNDRAHGQGDFHAGPECRLPETRPSGLWEYCGGLTSCWGYRVNEEKRDAVRLARGLLTELAICRAWGGNVLANCGPRPTGEMPDCYYACMNELKNWMAARREAVVGVAAGAFPERVNVPTTVRGKTWYAFLLRDDGKNKLGVLNGGAPVILKGVEKPQRVTMLGTGEALPSRFAAGELSISVPPSLRTPLVDVIKVEW